MAQTKTVAEWEKEDNNLINDAHLNDQESITRVEFDDLKEEKGYVGVDHEARTAFLEDNGHKLTRANYLNPKLTVKESEGESK